MQSKQINEKLRESVSALETEVELVPLTHISIGIY